MDEKRKARSGNLIGSGGAALAVSVFLPWVHVIILGDFSLMTLAQADHQAVLAYAVVAAGALLAAGGFQKSIAPKALGGAALVAALIAGAGAIVFAKDVAKLGALVTLSVGGYLAIAAAVLLLVGAVTALSGSGAQTVIWTGLSCPRCRTALSRSNSHCTTCGSPTPWTPSKTPDSQQANSAHILSCPFCLQAISDGASFCTHCGKEVKALALKSCRKCGARGNPQDKFCGSCGTASQME